MKNGRQFVFYDNKKVGGTKLGRNAGQKCEKLSNFIESDATKFITCLALLLAKRKNGGFLLVKK